MPSHSLWGALKSLTLSVPGSSQWPSLMHNWALVSWGLAVVTSSKL